jgi:hypothetical protein
MAESQARPTGPDPVKDPGTAGEPRAAGAGGAGGANAPMPTQTERNITEEDARAEMRRQVDEYNKQFSQGGASRYAMAQVMADTAQDPPVWEVMVDQWGAGPTLVRGQRIMEDSSPYDPYQAEARGVLRRLSLAEVRSQTPSSTLPLTGDGLAVDETLIMAGRFHAGFRTPDITGVLSDPNGNPVTVTTAGGPAEIPGQTKPTLPGPDNNDPAPRPVIVVEQGQDTRAAVEKYFEKEQPEAAPRQRAERESEAERETGKSGVSNPPSSQTPKK